MDQETLTRKSTRQNQENTCNVCHIQFSMTNRSVLCSKCYQKVCRLHITLDKTQTICELCLRIDLKRFFTTQKQDSLTALKSELRSLQHREKANLKEISLKTDLIQSLETSLALQQETFHTKLSHLEVSLGNECKSIEEINSMSLRMQNEIQDCRKNKKEKEEKFVNSTTELIRVQKDFEVVEEEVKELRKRSGKLIRLNERVIRFQKIRTVTCNKCYDEIVLRFKSEIIEILSRKEKMNELIESVLAIKPNEAETTEISSCKCLVS